MKVLDGTQSLKILWEHFKASNCWAVRFIHCKRLNLCWKTVQKFTTCNLENLMAYKCHTINQHQKYDCLSEVMQINNQFFLTCWSTLQLMQKDQNQSLSKQESMKNGEQMWHFLFLLLRVSLITLQSRKQKVTWGHIHWCNRHHPYTSMEQIPPLVLLWHVLIPVDHQQGSHLYR